MSKQILIELKAEDKATATINKTTNAVNNLGKKATNSMKETSEAVQDTVGQLESLGNRFRYLSLVFGLLSAGSVMFTKSIIDAAREAEQAYVKLGVFAISMGEDMEKTNKVANDLASTGLISVSEASEGLSNFLATGLGLDKATDLMYTFLNSASVAKTVMSDTVGTALTKAAVGFRTLSERQIDNVGIQAQLKTVWEDYATSLGKTRNSLTELEKYQAMYNYYMQEGSRFTGSADIVTKTFSGSINKLTANLTRLKIALGESIVPLVGTLTEMVTSATQSITSFANSNAGLTSAIISGTVILVAFVSALAMLGALVPMVTRGFQTLSTAGLMLVTTSGLKTIAVFLGLSVAIGGLIYLVLKATGQWDKWTSSIANLGERIKNSISSLNKFGSKTEELDKKTAKQLKNLEENIAKATRDFKEDMKEWVVAHDKTIKELKESIEDLQKDYSNSLNKIKKDFKSSMDELNMEHARKSEDIQRDLDEEISKGIWADQTRIRDLQLALKRENEDYEISKNKKVETVANGVKEETEKRNEKLTKLQEELNQELALQIKHSVLINQARTWPILDEIEKRTRAFSERMQQYNEEKNEILNSTDIESAALDGLIGKFSDLNAEIDKSGTTTETAVDKMISSLESLKKTVDENAPITEQIGARVRNATINVGENLTIGTSNALNRLPEAIGGAAGAIGNAASWLIPDPIEDVFKNFFRGVFKDGGIVPGGTSEAVPILAHGGETVLPAGVSPMTININNPTVRSDEDIQRIADLVKNVFSREQSLKRFM